MKKYLSEKSLLFYLLTFKQHVHRNIQEGKLEKAPLSCWPTLVCGSAEDFTRQQPTVRLVSLLPWPNTRLGVLTMDGFLFFLKYLFGSSPAAPLIC